MLKLGRTAIFALTCTLAVSCAIPKDRERELRTERDEAKKKLEDATLQQTYNERFAEAAIESLSAMEQTWHQTSIYLHVPNIAVDMDTHAKRHLTLNSQVQKISQGLFDLLQRIKTVRASPSVDQQFMDDVNAIGAMGKTVGELAGECLQLANSVLQSEKQSFAESALSNNAAWNGLNSEQRKAEAELFAKRQDILIGLNASCKRLQDSVPKLTCATFAAQCKEPK